MAASKAALTRLQKEYKAIVKEPVPGIKAHPSPSNILEWHFVLEGQPESEYAGGLYHGKVTFPTQYPYKPPSIQMITPNGRFATNTRLCLSMTDFHPESWNPMWSVSTILTGLYSFMHETGHTTGAISSTKAEKEKYARESLAFNTRNPTFRKLFPELVQQYEEQREQQRMAAAQQQQQHLGAQRQPAAALAQPAPAAAQSKAAAGPLQTGQQQQQQPQQQPALAGLPQQAGAPRTAGAAAGGGGGSRNGNAPEAGQGWTGLALGAAGVALLAVLLAVTLSTQPPAAARLL